MYESARQYIFSVIFIISGPQIITPLWKIKKPKNLSCCMLSKLCVIKYYDFDGSLWINTSGPQIAC